jgi:hypothetical protein
LATVNKSQNFNSKQKKSIAINAYSSPGVRQDLRGLALKFLQDLVVTRLGGAVNGNESETHTDVNSLIPEYTSYIDYHQT